MTSPRPVTDEDHLVRLPRLPSLDGWRALSIILVLGNHCIETAGFPPVLHPLFYWAFDGGLGVQIFFVISGFLITWLMLIEDGRSGHVNLSHFYARRGLRILPVYAAFLCVLAGLQLFTPYQQTRNAWISNLTFTTNFVDVTWTSGHLWSLAVEEQFYLLWPGLFVVLGVARNLRAAFWILTLPILLAPFLRVISYLKLAPPFLMPLFANYSFFNFFDSLAVGCGCALLFLHKRDRLRDWLTTKPGTVVVLALALILAPYVMRHLFVLGIINVPFGGILSAVGIAMLLLQSVLIPSVPFYRLLNKPLVCQIGVLSYSIYIWQQIFCTKPGVFGLERVWWMGFPGWLAPVLVVSFVSYYGLERPLFRLRARFRKP